MSAAACRYPEAMHEEATAVGLRPHIRLLHGMRRPANWLQLVRFGLVGAVGFIVNLAVYALFVHGIGVEYRIASVAAWIVAVANNFVWNRHWTFDAGEGVAHHQAMRFLLVSVVTEVISLLLLTAPRRVGRHVQGARPGDRRGRRDAAQLPRQQALELPRQGLTVTGLILAARPRAHGPARAARIIRTYTLTSPLGGSLCRRW